MIVAGFVVAVVFVLVDRCVTVSFQVLSSTLCYAIVLPGRKAGRRADGGAFPVAVRSKSGPEGRFPVQKYYCVK